MNAKISNWKQFFHYFHLLHLVIMDLAFENLQNAT